MNLLGKQVGTHQTVTVPGFFLDSKGDLKPLTATKPIIPSPADDGIQSGPGDDLSAPNSVTASRLNRVVCVGSANVGYSESAKDTQILPSGLEYDAVISEGTHANEFALTLRMTLEFTSCFPSEGMVVWMKKHQQFMNDEKFSKLLLIETAFEDFVNGAWLPITTDMRYTEEADAVVQAVITSDSGQTAGRVTTKEFAEDAKLGPVGAKGRIVLTYYCDNLYSYAEMISGGEPSGTIANSAKTLVPLGFQIPWAAIDNPANACSVAIRVQAPSGTILLDPVQNILAYQDLQESLAGDLVSDETKKLQGVIIPDIQTGSAWAFSRTALPPKPMMVLAWLSVPDVDFDWTQVEIALPKVTRATLLQPTPEEERLLQVGLPGCQTGHLYRCKVETEAPKRHELSVRVHTDILISDASGSTGMKNRGSSGGCVRENFNKHEERRVLKRLEAIPKLREAGILLPQDIWRQQFVIFDHGVKHKFGLETKIQDLDASTVDALVKALSATPDLAATTLLQAGGKQELLQKWSDVINQLRNVRPGGMTSFVEGTKHATSAYKKCRKIQGPPAEYTSYVNFDTDGGNNCGPCYDAIEELVREADVVLGHVLGIGSWVDQDCATKVAKLLKGSAELAMSFPESAAADEHFRADLSRWIKTLRASPVSITCFAGACNWTARHGLRNENAVDCIFATGDGARFDEPDVSEPTYTKSTLRGLMAGESTTLYMLSRLPFHQLVSHLRIEIAGVAATIGRGAESLQGAVLGHHWLSLFGEKQPKSIAKNIPSLCRRLRNRIEDDLSFSWNLPSTSGSTSALGRAKTEIRPSVSRDRQPVEPKLPELLPDPPVSAGRSVAWSTASPFGTPPLFGAVRASPPGAGVFGGANMVGGLFGANTGDGLCGAAPVGERGAAPGGAWGAAPPAGGGPFASFGAAPGPPSGGLFGAAPGANMGGGMMGATAPRGGFFGGTQQGTFGAPVEPAAQEPPTPEALLRCSAYMRCGVKEAPGAAAERGLRAVKVLAQYALQSQKVSKQSAEDPLVASILGGVAPQQPNEQEVHHGFHCDATHQTPIIGPRFKSTSTADHDLCLSARRAGNFAGGAGYRPISTRADGMRLALAAIMAWWWLLWPERADLFQVRVDLSTLNEAALIQAIRTLP